MTDRIGGFVVVLEADQREDDAEATLSALRMVRGVASVQPIVSNTASLIARAQARGEIVARLWKALDGWS